MTEQKENKYITLRVPKLNKTQLLLIAALMIASFLIGSLWTKMQYLEKTEALAKGATANAQDTAQQAPPQQVPPEDTTPKKVSIDDDPVLGDANAPVTMIDFTDYECPFCKRYFDETFSQIKK